MPFVFQLVRNNQSAGGTSVRDQIVLLGFKLHASRATQPVGKQPVLFVARPKVLLLKYLSIFFSTIRTYYFRE